VTVDPRTPVLVGAGTVVQRDLALDAAGLMREAAARAEVDAGAPGLVAAARLVLVPRGTWKDADPGRTVCPAAHSVLAALGVLQTTLIERACSAIAAGQVDVAVVVGGEAKWRERALGASGAPGAPADGGVPDETLTPDGMIISREEIDARLVSAVSQYALIENARRAADGQSVETHAVTIAGLWERFNQVAGTNPDAWNPEPMTASTIAEAGPSNRMLAWPYNKWHNSQWNVDQAGALIFCSASAAEAFGVPTDRWVFPSVIAWSDHMVPVSRRASIHRSPGFSLAAPLIGDVGGVDHMDLYSCFPIAVRTQALELGLPLERELTVTGGMTFAGGPLNNYVLQSMAAMAHVLRADAGSRGLVTAISGLITKQGVSVWSTSPPPDGYQAVNLSLAAAEATPVVGAAAPQPGPASIVTYTVLPEGRVVIVADAAAGGRAVAALEDGTLAASMMASEWCGRPVHLDGAGGFSPA